MQPQDFSLGDITQRMAGRQLLAIENRAQDIAFKLNDGHTVVIGWYDDSAKQAAQPRFMQAGKVFENNVVEAVYKSEIELAVAFADGSVMLFGWFDEHGQVPGEPRLERVDCSVVLPGAPQIEV